MTRDQILVLIPPDAVRVKVRSAKGREKYREVTPSEDDFESVLDTDEIILQDGKPVTMNRKPGRRKKASQTLPATTPHNAERQKQKEHLLATDMLIKKIDKKIREEPDSVLLLVMRGLAQEVISLEFEKRQAEAEGRDTSQISLRRTNALKTIAENYGRFSEEIGKTYRAQIEHLETKLEHTESTLDLLLIEMKRGQVPAGTILKPMWPNIIETILDEIRRRA